MPKARTNVSTRRALEADLVALLGKEALRGGPDAAPYQHDSTEMQGLQGRADAVVAPANTDAVSRLVAWAYQRGLPMIPRGGGTGFAGGAVPVNGGIVCSLERLTSVQNLEPEFWRMEVSAGITTGRIQHLARQSGLFYPPDPGAPETSQIGGNIACNAGGPHCFKYGTTGAWVTGVELVIKHGEVMRLGGPLRKDVAGYDLKSLVVGSEGTLGIITGAWLRLIPAPEAVLPLAAGYADLKTGLRALANVLANGLQPATLEYFDAECVAATRATFPGGIPAEVAFLITTEADGSESEAHRLAAELEQILGQGAIMVRRPVEPAAFRELQRWRSGIAFAVGTRYGGKMGEDIAVPLDRFGEAVEMLLAVGRDHGVPTCSWGHAGDGNLHANFLIDPGSPEQVRRAAAAADDLFGRTLALGGTVSGEHGLGWVKRKQFDRQFSSVAASVQRSIKGVFDPDNLFNPGKKIEIGAPRTPSDRY